MANFEDMSFGEKWVKVCSHQEVPLPSLIKTVSFVMSIPVRNAYLERLFSLMTCYWCKERNQCSEDLVKAKIQVQMNYGLLCKHLVLRTLASLVVATLHLFDDSSSYFTIVNSFSSTIQGYS
jgi:hypothetical protein